MAYLNPSYLALFRQNFNFQVLDKIILFVNDPLFGETHGAISFGIRQQFLGANLLYGTGEDWTLTSTWIGPAFIDFGILGVILTMISIAIIMQFLKINANKFRTRNKFKTLYLVTLVSLLSLFEDGMDLSVIIFLIVMLYLTIMNKNG